jgi:hypothetical protein
MKKTDELAAFNTTVVVVHLRTDGSKKTSAQWCNKASERRGYHGGEPPYQPWLVINPKKPPALLARAL